MTKVKWFDFQVKRSKVNVRTKPYMVKMGGWIVKWVASSGRLQRSRVRFPAAQKVLGTDGICKYLPVSVSSYMLVFVVFGLYYLIYSIVVNLGAGL